MSEQLERDIEAVLEARIGRECVFMPSGRFAIHLAFQLLLSPGDRILMSPLEDDTVFFGALAAGLRPVMAPVSAHDGNMRIDAIDGVPITDILRRLRVYRGGPNNLRDFDDVSLLESPELLHAAGLAKSDQEMTLLVSDADLHTKAIKLSALAPAPHEARVAALRYLAAPPVIDEASEWRSAFQNRPAALWLQEPDRAFRLVPILDLSAVYLQLKTNADAENGERISAFLSQARRAMAEFRPQNVILDMRFNGGGDYTKTASFMTDLPKMIAKDGRIFVITDAATFSAGITSVGFVKQASPLQTIIVGEPIGDRLVFYGEPRRLMLPNSRIGMNYATGLHDYLHGCRWFGPCYWVNWIYPVSVATLDPDLSAPVSFAAVAAGRDPAIEAIRMSLGLPTPGP